MSANARALRYGLAVVGLLLAGWAGMRAAGVLVEARSGALHDAERAIAQATAPLIEQRRIPDRLIVAVEALVGGDDLHIGYLTLRNADNVTLVSRGHLGDTFGWLPTDLARAWRGWLYRVGAAEDNRAVMRDERRVGDARYGVGWLHVVGRAGAGFFMWAGLAALGVIGFLFGLFGRDTSRRRTADASASRPSGAAIASTAGADRGRSARAPLSRLISRRRETADDFAPIAAKPRQSYDTLVGDRGRTAAPSGSSAAAGAEQSGDAVAHSAPSTGSPAAADAWISPTSDAGRSTSTEAPPAESDLGSPAVPALQPASSSAGSSMTAPVPGAAYAPEGSLHAPSLDAVPQLGDDTLDLKLYPVWQGSGPQRRLAAAQAMLAWRSGEAHLVDPATLTQLAEHENALRAFTQWIARRFSLLHGNWRTLELATVPILLQVPSALLAFADAESIWREALRRTDRDPDDLILRVAPEDAKASSSGLPVRRALTLDSPEADIADQCDLLCLDADDVDGAQASWRDVMAGLDRPVLLGPIADPEEWSDLIEAGACWYRDSADALHSPRSFGRLLARQAVQPI
ncbi:EAL domain-containing protein [Salinisphaera orenii]|uniref:EAL domain-containing protein n=1 Tax=Salinisphaera orenii YIM 95161 TaxID=1051139 RepID=A0A423PLK4_9GAMM|nr:EAL domain-containing protein [Salinisphaera halophila]ROO26485.1 hypothetical protein SAHL_12755 [Salinisphaera halophila YIM 95161]